MRTKSSFYRTNEISKERSQKLADWLDEFAENYAVKTAVEVSRTRGGSIAEQMVAIVTGQKNKFSSVDEVVKHYQERTGLNNYLGVVANSKLKLAAEKRIDECSDADDENPEEPEDPKNPIPKPIGMPEPAPSTPKPIPLPAGNEKAIPLTSKASENLKKKVLS